MFSRIYIEEEALNHPRTEKLLKRFPKIERIICHHYGEIFNIKNQNFRIQKQNPALIIAIKKGKKILSTPENFGIGCKENYYFSHMQNCLYDCRYCFLQGMYNSAHYLWFINYEDFFEEIENLMEQQQEEAYFFSGYDCDSLALEGITSFAEEFLPFFLKYPQAILELRTKSVNIKSLQNCAIIKNCIIAFSFTPDEISRNIEHKVPPVRSRIRAMQLLANLGWQVGLRFDPLIYSENYQQEYRKLLADIFANLDRKQIHSISIGPLRFPEKIYDKIAKLYPNERLLSDNLTKRAKLISYSKEIEAQLQNFILEELKKYISDKIIFSCVGF